MAVRAGARVVATTRSPKKVDLLLQRGAHEVYVDICVCIYMYVCVYVDLLLHRGTHEVGVDLR